MKTKLKAISSHLRRMEMEAVHVERRNEYRRDELAKLFAERAADFQDRILKLADTRKQVIDSFQYHPTDTPEDHARRYRYDTMYAAMPVRDLIAVDPTTLDYEAQYARAASIRKRGEHAEADIAYTFIRQQQEAWKGSEVVKAIDKEITRLTLLLPDADTDKIYIGDGRSMDRTDWARVENGTITFEDNGEKYAV